MLKGINKNLKENYNQKISLKKKEQLKNKEDVNVNEAFEIYMLKNFFNIKLNNTSKKILSFWENDFDISLKKHIKFLNDNVENQNLYNSKFSEVLKEMGIFNSENENNDHQENKNNDEEIDNNQKNKSDNEQNEGKKEESESGIKADYDLNEYSVDEQLIDTDSDTQNSESIIQKISIDNIDKNYIG